MVDQALVHSSFDSEIFKMRFLRVVDPNPTKVLEELESENGPIIVDLKIDAFNQKKITEFLRLGFRKSTTLITLLRPVDSAAVDPEATRKIFLSDTDLTDHAKGFIFQRFKQDPAFSSQIITHFMRTWVKNSLGGRRDTLAIGKNFCTFYTDRDTLKIDLVSVLDRGQGIGKRLLSSVMAVAAQKGLSNLEVTTEAENTHALRLYIQSGYVPNASWVALHLVRKNA